MSHYSDTELMAMLGSALSPPSTTPDGVTLARLHATLADLANESNPATPSRLRRSKSFAGLRGQVVRRTSVIAAAMLLLTGGVATAAVATDTLPGPTRNIAYALGLPVTSPGLFEARANLNELKLSIAEGNRSAEVRWGKSLQSDLKSLNDNDLALIRAPALSVLSEVNLEDPLPSPLTTPSTSPTAVDNSDSDANSSTVTITVPSSSNQDTSDADPANSTPLIPTLTVPSPSVVVPTTIANSDGSGDLLPVTTLPLSIDQVPTGETLAPVSGDLSLNN